MAETKTASRQQGQSAQTNPSSRMAEAAKPILDATGRVREAAGNAIGAGAKAVDDAPLAALAGAIAFGAVAAALIPATARELSSLGPLGTRIRGLLNEAFDAAKAAGIEQLTAKGLTSTALTSGVGTAAGHVITAALAASSAAGSTVRRRGGQQQGSQANDSKPNAGEAQGGTSPVASTTTGSETQAQA